MPANNIIKNTENTQNTENTENTNTGNTSNTDNTGNTVKNVKNVIMENYERFLKDREGTQEVNTSPDEGENKLNTSSDKDDTKTSDDEQSGKQPGEQEQPSEQDKDDRLNRITKWQLSLKAKEEELKAKEEELAELKELAEWKKEVEEDPTKIISMLVEHGVKKEDLESLLEVKEDDPAIAEIKKELKELKEKESAKAEEKQKAIYEEAVAEYTDSIKAVYKEKYSDLGLTDEELEQISQGYVNQMISSKNEISPEEALSDVQSNYAQAIDDWVKRPAVVKRLEELGFFKGGEKKSQTSKPNPTVNSNAVGAQPNNENSLSDDNAVMANYKRWLERNREQE